MTCCEAFPDGVADDYDPVRSFQSAAFETGRTRPVKRGRVDMARITHPIVPKIKDKGQACFPGEPGGGKVRCVGRCRRIDQVVRLLLEYT